MFALTIDLVNNFVDIVCKMPYIKQHLFLNNFYQQVLNQLCYNLYQREFNWE